MKSRAKRCFLASLLVSAWAFSILLAHQRPSWALPMFCVFILAAAGLLVVSGAMLARS